MVRFDLLPFTAYNDYEDLTNDEFLERIHDPIDAGEIAVSSFFLVFKTFCLDLEQIRRH